MDFSILLTWNGIVYLVILSLLEIVLGIDNIIFVSIVCNRLPKERQRFARNIGLTMALLVRLILLTMAAWLMKMTSPLFSDNLTESIPFLKEFSMQSVVLLAGGALFDL